MKTPLPRGFTLIELMISVVIVAILAATALPAYNTFIKNTQLKTAGLNIREALIHFSIDMGYSPATNMLEDLVSYGYLDAIPNDPWTVVGGATLAKKSENNSTMLAQIGIQAMDLLASPAWATTGAEEADDWYYANDGSNLTMYPYSHPGNVLTITSLGQPPFSVSSSDSSSNSNSSSDGNSNSDNSSDDNSNNSDNGNSSNNSNNSND